jgi:RHH-type proline utilization regulon transcriptional repressor/proline dehydrogenase/delta 1-pyrroline-5-carboxylate dehydrogenase
MRELRVGDPGLLETDVGPVIDEAAQQKILAHVERLRAEAKEIYTVEEKFLNEDSLIPLPLAGGVRGEGTPTSATSGCGDLPHLTCPSLDFSSSLSRGEEPDRARGINKSSHFILPQAWEIPSIGWLTGEVFGPILHVVRYQPEALGELIAQINATGFGLTGGLHSRIEATVRQVERDLRVGNFYVNRSMVGAVVGVQPFGGQGVSGTGPKAGGPHYLPRFATECVTSNNVTAAGGNASLMMIAAK